MPAKKYHHGDLKNALIKAGIEILSKEGAAGLSLREVAKRAGVSHSAPYSHFQDKQSLIAAIATEGLRQLYAEMQAAILPHADDPKRQLIEGTWAYAQFALNHTDTFRVVFSIVLEEESDYPAFVEISRKTFGLVMDSVRACQAKGLMRPAPPELIAVSLWGQVHGILSLVLDGQLPPALGARYDTRQMVSMAIELMTQDAGEIHPNP